MASVFLHCRNVYYNNNNNSNKNSHHQHFMNTLDGNILKVVWIPRWYGFTTIILVILTLITTSVSNGMPVVEGCLLPSDFLQFCLYPYVSWTTFLMFILSLMSELLWWTNLMKPSNGLKKFFCTTSGCLNSVNGNNCDTFYRLLEWIWWRLSTALIWSNIFL
jgi:hypothetical protein